MFETSLQLLRGCYGYGQTSGHLSASELRLQSGMPHLSVSRLRDRDVGAEPENRRSSKLTDSDGSHHPAAWHVSSICKQDQVAEKKQTVFSSLFFFDKCFGFDTSAPSSVHLNNWLQCLFFVVFAVPYEFRFFTFCHLKKYIPLKTKYIKYYLLVSRFSLYFILCSNNVFYFLI